MKTCLDMRAADLTEVYSPALFNERSMQLGVSTGVAAELQTGWNLCSSELRTAKPRILTATPPCPLFLKLQNTTILRKSIQLESAGSTVITIGSHLIICYARMLLNRCIVVVTSSSNIHRTRRSGMNCVFRSSLSDQTKLELTCFLLEAR